LRKDALRFSFPEVHPAARLAVHLQRTLRIPDDGSDYPLPPGLGRFPLKHVDDYAERVSSEWIEHGGVMFPMYQSEAMWLNFSSTYGYPFALRVAAGKIDAVAGGEWSEGLQRQEQNYLVVPSQPWLDGFCVEKGTIRQFVAMPLGAGYTAEEQITGMAEHGGLQLQAYPLKAEAWERMQKPAMRRLAFAEDACYAASPRSVGMGLAPGGRMRQEIYEDDFEWEDWDRSVSSRCFVHLVNSLVWRAMTGKKPPTTPPTSKEYKRAGVPWFDYYDDRRTAVDGSEVLAALKSVAELGAEKGDMPLPENESVEVERVRNVGRKKRPDQVREGVF
jgi:hypothetical protein